MQTSSYSIMLAREIEAARAGDATDLVVSLYTYRLPAQARRLARLFPSLSSAVEDLVQVGAEEMLRCLEKALYSPGPVGYLLLAAKGAMWTYCQEQRSTIRVPANSQRRGKRVPDVLSLETTVSEDKESQATLADVLADPHDAILALFEDEQDILAQAWERLKGEERQILRLWAQSSSSSQQVAASLGLTSRTCRYQVQRAKEHLRRQYLCLSQAG